MIRKYITIGGVGFMFKPCSSLLEGHNVLSIDDYSLEKENDEI